MKAEEFLKSIYGDEIESPLFPTDEILELLRQFGSIKCKEQREICADNADSDYNFIGNRDENSHIEVYVLRHSIIDCPEPEM